MSGNTHNIDCLILSGDIFSLGGIQTYCRQVFGALESGFKDKNFVSLVLNDTPGHELEKWQNIKIFFCAQIKISLFKKIYFVFKALKLSFVVRPKFILCCHTHIAPIALLIKCFFGIDYGVIVYGSDVWDLRKGMRFQALKEAGLIISLSNYTRARIIDNGLDGKNLMVLHPAVDTSFFRPLSANKELSQRLMLDNKKVLLIIARMDSREKQKGHDVMLEVMRRLSDNFVLVIFGNGDDVGRLKKKSNELGIADKVRFHPAFSGSDTLDFYNLCDVFVMPSKQEGFGIVFIKHWLAVSRLWPDLRTEVKKL